MNWQLFSAFLVITVVLFLTPGPIVTLVISTGVRQGSRAAILTVAGATIGNALLLTAIAFGLNWILKASVQVFETLRWVGAAYLIWLGIQAWRQASARETPPPPKGHVHAWRGFMVAITNPKSIAFFTAFLPQFVDPALPAGFQLLIMCVCSVAMGFVLDCGWGIAAAAGRAFFMKPRHNRLLGRISAVMLVGGGIWLSLARRPV